MPRNHKRSVSIGQRLPPEPPPPPPPLGPVTGYVAAGAGHSEVNGRYVPEDTGAGGTQYRQVLATEGIDAFGFIYFEPGDAVWAWSGGDGGTTFYYIENGTPELPLTGWIPNDGSTAPPTLAPVYD